jgi:hypothetical protein
LRKQNVDIVSTPAARNPAAMAWPASPKPMNAIAGLPFGMATVPLSLPRMMAVSARALQWRRFASPRLPGRIPAK